MPGLTFLYRWPVMRQERDAVLPFRKPHPSLLSSDPSLDGRPNQPVQVVSTSKRYSISSAVTSPNKVTARSSGTRGHLHPGHASSEEEDDLNGSGHISLKDIMASRPLYNHPSDARSATPLLVSGNSPSSEDWERPHHKYGSHSPSGHMSPQTSPPPSYSRSQSPHTHHSFSARQALRSVSPTALAGTGSSSVRRKWIIASIFLVVSLVSFCVQTELAKMVQTDMGWDKAYCMLYLTHGSWSLIFPTQLVFLRLKKRAVAWDVFWRNHWKDITSTAWEVQHQKLSHSRRSVAIGSPEEKEVLLYVVRMTAIVTTALTIAGLSWYIAVNMTSASDLTAIYNCSAFFAYAFSVPLLKEPFRLDKSIAVLIAIVGVLVVAYGDGRQSARTNDEDHGSTLEGRARLVGNLVIGFGSILYGLYEVLYKRFACPPEVASASRSVIFANAFGSCIGMFTLTVLWIPLPILHWIGWETFELPTGHTAWLLFLSVIMNATFAGSFLVLISLTSPVLSSVAALLTIFIVALSDWLLTGEPLSGAALAGGLLIVLAFGMLSWSTWREMSEHARMRETEEAEEGAETVGSSDTDETDEADDEEESGAYSRAEEGRRMLS